MENLNLNTVAVTGATGFVGRNLVDALAAKGYEVHSFGRKPVAGTTFHWWEATAEPKPYGIPFKAIIHCAASATDWGDDEVITKVNVAGTTSALAIDQDARFIHMSTASVYACKGDSFHLTEETTTSAPFLNSYIESKIEAESVVIGNKRDAGTFILRPHAVYGKGDTTLLPRVEKALRGRFLPLPGGGKSLVSLTHIDNLVDVTLDLVAYTGDRSFDIFNVADHSPVALGEALVEILRRRGKAVSIAGIPSYLAWDVGYFLEKIAKGFKLGQPAITRYLVSQLGYAETLDVTRIENFLGRTLPQSNFHDASQW